MSFGPFSFRLGARCPQSHARTGVFETPHGAVPTPAFMPVGTRGTVKGILPRDLAELGSTMVLANTLHLHLRPGEETVARLGGLHRFMNWDGPILTDSGGYQVFSMADISRTDEDGVGFKSIVDGSLVRFTPERVMDIQRALGADVVMAFDHVPVDPLDRAQTQESTDRTHRWLERCVRRWRDAGGVDTGQALFGIVQGGAFEDLRHASVDAVCEHDLPGYAVGGVSLGEEREAMRAAFAAATPRLPEDRPRYLMGIGTPLDFFDAVEQGADLFDCVTPTRHGRTHQMFTKAGILNVRNSGWKDSTRPIDPEWPCPSLEGFTLGVLRHLCTTREMLGATLLSLQNLHFFHCLLREMRAAIEAGTLAQLRAEILPRCTERVAP
ncbi:MAG: tRNA guanosine(34) transglycosylase Tgt [bacterium]|nr:tRNA guanosine(34) transglycosylase Tgt [bacterium]